MLAALLVTGLLLGPLADEAPARKVRAPQRTRLAKLKKTTSRLLAGIVALSLIAPSVPALAGGAGDAAPSSTAKELVVTPQGFAGYQRLGAYVIPSTQIGVIDMQKHDARNDYQALWRPTYAKNPLAGHLLEAAARLGIGYQVVKEDGRSVLLRMVDAKKQDTPEVGLLKLHISPDHSSIQIFRPEGKGLHLAPIMLRYDLDDYGLKL